MSHFWYRFAQCVTRISTAFSCILLLCIYSQTSKIHSGSGGGQRTKTVSSFYSLEFSTTSSHAGEIGSDVISEKSLPFERQTQRVSPPCLACLLSLIFFCVVCLLGQQMGTSHYHRSQFPLTDLTAIFSPFFTHTQTFSPFCKRQQKNQKISVRVPKRISADLFELCLFYGFTTWLTIVFVLACTFNHFSQATKRFLQSCGN